MSKTSIINNSLTYLGKYVGEFECDGKKYKFNAVKFKEYENKYFLYDSETKSVLGLYYLLQGFSPLTKEQIDRLVETEDFEPYHIKVLEKSKYDTLNRYMIRELIPSVKVLKKSKYVTLHPHTMKELLPSTNIENNVSLHNEENDEYNILLNNDRTLSKKLIFLPLLLKQSSFKNNFDVINFVQKINTDSYSTSELRIISRYITDSLNGEDDEDTEEICLILDGHYD